MSKRRKEEGDVEEDKPFKVPKFDEEAFLKKEKRNIKTSFISFLFGCFMALICFGFWVLMGKYGLRWELVLLVAVINAVFIKYIFIKLKIDIVNFSKMNWFTSFAIYFFTWLIVFIVLVNPPFYDDENPKVSLAVLPEMQELGNPVEIVAKITDNSVIQKSCITFLIDGEEISPDNYEFASDIFSYKYTKNNIVDGSTIRYLLSVKDSHGLITERSGTFKYSNNTIFVPDPLDVDVPPGPRIGSATSIKFKVGTDVTRLYYTINNGTPINVTQKEGDFFITYPKYKGWSKGNATMKVFAEKNYTFEVVSSKNPSQMSSEEYQKFIDKVNSNIFGNKIVDTQTYFFQVADESGVGIETSPIAEEAKVGIVTVPGFEIIVFLVSLIVVLLIFKYRKKNKQ